MPKTFVYNQLSQSELDRQYDVRSAVPEFENIFSRWGKAAAELTQSCEQQLNIAYGEKPAQKLDVFIPSGKTTSAPYPVSIFIHGGYWSSRSKEEHHIVIKGILEAGSIAVLIGYDLIPTVRMPELVRQCQAAVSWVYSNSAAFGGDADKLFICGNSAGAHLVSLMMATDWQNLCNLPVDILRGGCALSVLSDLAPVRLSFIQKLLDFSEDDVEKYSPITQKPATTSPFIVAVGSDETDEFKRQSLTLADSWNKQGGKCQFIECPGRNHFTIVDDFIDPSTALAKAFKGMVSSGKT